MLRALLALAATLVSLQAADLRVATLHPLLTDLARQVGGEFVEVVDLVGPNGDPHHFEPKPEDLARAAGSRLYLAAGLGLEADLPALKSILRAPSEIVEVGATLPVIHGGCNDPDHDHHAHHDHAIDPHWWQSLDCFRRATTVVAEAFAAADPQHAERFRANAVTYRAKLDELERWSRTRLARIPKDRRQLATAHAAFNYFCRDFGFTPLPVAGLNREQEPDATGLAAMVADLKKRGVLAVFPEKESNPKLLEALTRGTGIRLGGALIADGMNVKSYEAMVRHNVDTIVAALTS